MTPLDETTFVVCDVETTGMSPAAERVTEICLLKLRAGRIVDTFESLVNPRRYIPEAIVRLTGITNAMVLQAPPMEALIDEVRAFLDGTAFVAHNASFDWGFVSQECARASRPAPAVPVLCTVRLARRLVPGQRSYSLHNITAALGIPLRGHHRARADTEATATLFGHLLERARTEHGIETLERLAALQHRRTDGARTRRAASLAEQARALPESPGVYFFHDRRGEILYVGKARNLRARVRSYFIAAQQETRKVRGLLRSAARISHEEHPSELHALLREARLIEDHQPKFNSALRRRRAFPFLRLTRDEFPRLELAQRIANDGAEYFGPFRTHGTATLALDLATRLFRLRPCEERLHPDAATHPCFYHDIGRCGAPCAARQDIAGYGEEVARVRAFLAAGPANIVRELETRMQAHADRLEFEEAAYLRDRMTELRGVVEKPFADDPSVRGQNYLFALPAGARRWDLYFVRSGRLRRVVRASAARLPAARLARAVAGVFDQEELQELSQNDAREMRILSGWITQHRATGVVIPVAAGTTPADVVDAVRKALGSASLSLDHDQHESVGDGGIEREHHRP